MGEKLHLRGYLGLVGLPCSGKVAVSPEILVPAGVEYVDEDVRWDLTEAGTTQQLAPNPLTSSGAPTAASSSPDRETSPSSCARATRWSSATKRVTLR